MECIFESGLFPMYTSPFCNMPSDPISGVYLIKNLKTKDYIAAESSIVPGGVVTVDERPHSQFSVDEVDGALYTIASVSFSLYVAPENKPPDGQDPRLVWSRLPYKWKFVMNSPGVWNIRDPADDLFWFNDQDLSHIILKKRSDDDGYNWKLVVFSR